jgi:hypothetical protein
MQQRRLPPRRPAPNPSARARARAPAAAAAAAPAAALPRAAAAAAAQGPAAGDEGARGDVHQRRQQADHRVSRHGSAALEELPGGGR